MSGTILSNKLKSQSGNEFDLENKDLPASTTMDGVALADQTWVSAEIADNTGVSKSPVKAVVTNLPAYTYDNGTAGVGATLTADANGAWSDSDSDGVTLSLNERVVIPSVTYSTGLAQVYEAGIYQISDLGDGSNPWVLTRVTDFDEADEWIKGSDVQVEAGGSTCANCVFQYQGDSEPVIGTDDTTMTFTRLFSVGANSITETELNTSVAGDGLSGGGGTALSVNVDDSTIETSGGNLQVKALGITDTQINDVSTSKISGTLNDATVSSSNVTQHEGDLSIDAGTQLTSTLDDSTVAESNVTQHEAALSISSSQVTGLEDGSFTLGNCNTGTYTTIDGGDIVSVDSNGDVYKAIGPTTDDLFYTISGQAINGFPVTAETRPYQVFGLNVDSGDTLAIGDKIYLSESTAGEVTNTKPSAKARYIGTVIETSGFGKYVLDGMTPKPTGTDVSYDRADGSKKNIAAASDDLELAVNDLDDAVGALPTPSHYSPSNDQIVADHLSAIDDEMEGSNKAYVTTVNYDSGTPITLKASVPSGSHVVEVKYNVLTSFDGTTPTLAVGVSGDTSAIAGTGAVDLTATGVTTAPNTWYTMLSTTDVIGTLSVTGATQGSVEVMIRRVK